MIQVTKMDKEVFFLNPLHIESVVETPDTVVTLNNGKKILLEDTAESLVHKMIEFWRAAYHLEARAEYLSKMHFQRKGTIVEKA